MRLKPQQQFLLASNSLPGRAESSDFKESQKYFLKVVIRIEEVEEARPLLWNAWCGVCGGRRAVTLKRASRGEYHFQSLACSPHSRHLLIKRTTPTSLAFCLRSDLLEKMVYVSKCLQDDASKKNTATIEERRKK